MYLPNKDDLEYAKLILQTALTAMLIIYVASKLSRGDSVSVAVGTV